MIILFNIWYELNTLLYKEIQMQLLVARNIQMNI